MTGGGGRKKGRGRRILLYTQAKEFTTMILTLKTVNLQASWRADCAGNVNILFCLAINSGPARDQMKYSIVERKFSVKVFGYQMKVICHSSAIILFQFQSSLSLLKTLLFYVACVNLFYVIWMLGEGERGQWSPDHPTLPRGSATVPDSLVLSNGKTSFKELRLLNYFSSFPVRFSSLSSVLF